MRTIFICALVIISAAAAFGQDNEYQTMTGTDQPALFESSENGNCYIFRKYVVKTETSDDGGQNVSVFESPAGPASKNACLPQTEPYFYVPDTDNYAFFGLVGPLMLIDKGTSADSRDFEIFDLTSRRSVITGAYSGDPKVVEGRFLLYDWPTDKKGALYTCKEAAKWKRQGGSVGWVQGKRLDLQTLKETNVGALRCVYVE